MNGESDRECVGEAWDFSDDKEHKNDCKWYERTTNEKNRIRLLDEVTEMLRSMVNIFDIISNHLLKK